MTQLVAREFAGALWSVVKNALMTMAMMVRAALNIALVLYMPNLVMLGVLALVAQLCDVDRAGRVELLDAHAQLVQLDFCFR